MVSEEISDINKTISSQRQYLIELFKADCSISGDNLILQLMKINTSKDENLEQLIDILVVILSNTETIFAKSHNENSKNLLNCMDISHAISRYLMGKEKDCNNLCSISKSSEKSTEKLIYRFIPTSPIAQGLMWATILVITLSVVATVLPDKFTEISNISKYGLTQKAK